MHPLLSSIALAAVCLCGCGYHLLDDGVGGPAPAVRLGEITDGTPWGDLGLRVRDRLRAGLEGRSRPVLVTGPGAPIVSGRVTTVGRRIVGYDAHRHGATAEVTVQLALHLETEDGHELWASGPIRRAAPWPRGRSVVDSAAARRRACEVAVDDAVNEGVRRFLSSAPTAVSQ